GPVIRSRSSETIDDHLQRFVPRHTFELAFALASDPDRRMQQAVGSVHALTKPPDLRADETLGHRVLERSVDVHDPSVLHGDVQRARVRTVEWTGGLDD